MKSLKALCAELCWEKGFAPELWPQDVYKDERRKRFQRILDYNERNFDENVGWMNGISGALQVKDYVALNVATYWKYRHTTHKIGAGLLSKGILIHYCPELEGLYGS